VKTAVEAVTSSGGSVPFDLPSFPPLSDADLDECASPTDNDCDAQATCKNTPEGHLCTCKEGFVGSGVICTEGADNTKSEGATTTDSSGTIIGVAVGISIVVVIIVVVVVVLFILRGKNKQKRAVTPHTAIPDQFKSVAAPEKFKPSFMAEEPKSKPVEQAEPEPETEPLIVPVVVAVPAPEPAPEPEPTPAPASAPLRPQSLPQHVGTRPEETLTLGQRVVAHGYQAGVIMYIGELQNMPSMKGMIYVGIKLDRAEGSGDGSVNGVQYFDCDAFCSVFVTPHAVKPEKTTE